MQSWAPWGGSHFSQHWATAHIFYSAHVPVVSSFFLSFVLICATGVQLTEITPRTREKAGTGTDKRTATSAKEVSRGKAAYSDKVSIWGGMGDLGGDFKMDWAWMAEKLEVWGWGLEELRVVKRNEDIWLLGGRIMKEGWVIWAPSPLCPHGHF